MTAYPFDWVDAFSDRAFGGNPCVVVHDADRLELGQRMALVRETRLSECAYVVRSERADFGARYYLAEAEIPLAGHPTVATVASLVRRGRVDLSSGRAELTLEIGAGVLPIIAERGDDGLVSVTMTQPAPRFGATHDPQAVAALYGLPADAVVGVPQLVSTGTPYVVTVLSDGDALARARLDAERLAAFQAGLDEPDPEAIEPFLVTLEGATPGGDTLSRLLLAPPNPPEDSFTGSATGCMAAYLWRHGLINRPRLIAEQGHHMGRPGRAAVEVLGPRDAITGVRVGGTAVVLMDGTLHL